MLASWDLAISKLDFHCTIKRYHSETTKVVSVSIPPKLNAHFQHFIFLSWVSNDRQYNTPQRLVIVNIQEPTWLRPFLLRTIQQNRSHFAFSYRRPSSDLQVNKIMRALRAYRFESCYVQFLSEISNLCSDERKWITLKGGLTKRTRWEHW